MTADGAALVVDHLRVEVYEGRAWTELLHDVSFAVAQGEVFGLAGESGCGKSTVAYALLGYARPGARIRSGQIVFGGSDVLQMSGTELRRLRGAKVALVPQNPATSLTPSIRIVDQIAETLAAHGTARGGAAVERSHDLLTEVGLPDPIGLGHRYPHELSGGQQQRVVIAIAIASHPTFLVLDEPTTALDVTTQAHILSLLRRLQRDHRMGMLYVSHNVGVLSQMCDRIGVMYAGALIELAPAEVLMTRPRHPYSRGLIAAVPSLTTPNTGARLRGLLRRLELPSGCPFAPRCDYSRAECFGEPQALTDVGNGQSVACWRWQAVEIEAGETTLPGTAAATDGRPAEACVP